MQSGVQQWCLIPRAASSGTPVHALVLFCTVRTRTHWETRERLFCCLWLRGPLTYDRQELRLEQAAHTAPGVATDRRKKRRARSGSTERGNGAREEGGGDSKADAELHARRDGCGCGLSLSNCDDAGCVGGRLIQAGVQGRPAEAGPWRGGSSGGVGGCWGEHESVGGEVRDVGGDLGGASVFGHEGQFECGDFRFEEGGSASKRGLWVSVSQGTAMCP